MQDSSSNNAKFSVVIPECFDRERREVKRVNKLTPRLPRPPDYELHAKTDPKSAEKQPKISRKSEENRKKIAPQGRIRPWHSYTCAAAQEERGCPLVRSCLLILFIFFGKIVIFQ